MNNEPRRAHGRPEAPRVGLRVVDLDGAEGVPGVAAAGHPDLAAEARHGALRSAWKDVNILIKSG